MLLVPFSLFRSFSSIGVAILSTLPLYPLRLLVMHLQVVLVHCLMVHTHMCHCLSWYDSRSRILHFGAIVLCSFCRECQCCVSNRMATIILIHLLVCSSCLAVFVVAFFVLFHLSFFLLLCFYSCILLLPCDLVLLHRYLRIVFCSIFLCYL
jgi:hypothetical protein